MRDARGFTLIELMVVVAILAAVAGGVIMAFRDVEDRAGLDIARGEIMKIKEAILKFKQDTGFFPGQGPFRLASQGGSIPSANLPSYVASLPVADQEKWFDSPANFWLVYGRDVACQSPLCGTGHALENWNRDTGRGWRGPYLSRLGEGLVDVGDNLQTNGTGNPLAGNGLKQVRGVADPFVATPFAVASTVDSDLQLLDWRTMPGDTPHDRWGRPYFLFDPGNSNARIVGMGENRIYDNGTGDDIVLDLLK